MNGNSPLYFRRFSKSFHDESVLVLRENVELIDVKFKLKILEGYEYNLYAWILFAFGQITRQFFKEL